jgi:hypothetical protein
MITVPLRNRIDQLIGPRQRTKANLTDRPGLGAQALVAEALSW